MAHGAFAVGEVLTAANLNAHIIGGQIGEATPSSGTSFILANNITQNFRHLRIVGRLVHNDGSGGNTHNQLRFRFNNDATAIYNGFTNSWDVAGTQTTLTAASATSGLIGSVGDSTGTFSFDILDYTSTSAKQVHGVGYSAVGALSTTNWRQYIAAAAWSSTAAITRVDLIMTGTDAFSGGRVSLYGLA